MSLIKLNSPTLSPSVRIPFLYFRDCDVAKHNSWRLRIKRSRKPTVNCRSLRWLLQTEWSQGVIAGFASRDKKTQVRLHCPREAVRTWVWGQLLRRKSLSKAVLSTGGSTDLGLGLVPQEENPKSQSLGSEQESRRCRSHLESKVGVEKPQVGRSLGSEQESRRCRSHLASQVSASSRLTVSPTKERHHDEASTPQSSLQEELHQRRHQATSCWITYVRLCVCNIVKPFLYICVIFLQFFFPLD